MPRYFFDIDDGVHLPDDNGMRLAELAEVEPHALRMLADIARYKSEHKRGVPLNVTVREATGLVVYRASITIQVEWVGKAPA